MWLVWRPRTTKRPKTKERKGLKPGLDWRVMISGRKLMVRCLLKELLNRFRKLKRTLKLKSRWEPWD